MPYWTRIRATFRIPTKFDDFGAPISPTARSLEAGNIVDGGRFGAREVAWSRPVIDKGT